MDILVVGSGVAGPAVAHFLTRQGHDVTVVERAPSLRSGGYKVDVRGAAATVLHRMGVYDQAKAADTGMRRITYVNRHGKGFAELPADLIMGRRDDDLEVMRGDLGRILHDAAGAAFVFGDAIAELHDGPDAVDVTFAGGRTGRYDLVVAADGLHSATRRLAFGEQPLAHLGGYISIFTMPNTLGIDHEEVMFSEPGRLTFAYARGPAEPMHVGMIFAGPAGHERRDGKRLVADAFAGGGWRTGEFLSAMEGADDFYFDSLSQVEAPRWSSGRVVLLGDAAHCPAPSSGQGTSLALVGAYVLADSLASHPVPEAFAAYEERMRPYVAKNMEFGRKMVKDMVPGGRLAIAFRNYGMRTLKFHPKKEQVIEKVLAPLREAANAVTL
ncbi:FAD-dependent oxidoreductase [Paractinoplanes lichenicola]|uniref:FAD-dependent monooxygenase n=1 Tax=Paractinoplanes lichenicola TaxID=2802976 RepID=A0ABS1W5I1_9ACTN|nr:FAD-dependent oxidoreductase [Actinoplanes lichenicola]MBL7261982.1 FAD-dependent monooxygenase [Actinoplanes lichenicola]